ncbi:response regulator [Nisaea nitritireducens]|uniref:response regulator n=1 Tax=Nisaea nitritireducens TaxID=568392 RepID=UPI00186930DB|nr:response regulator [Nisaea nitritireducens]
MNREKDQSLAGDGFDQERDRLEAFADVSNGWFWETDENHRFIYVSGSVERLAGRTPEWHFGKSREDVGGRNVRPEVWQAHLDDLEARRPFESFVYRRLAPHAELWVRTSGAPRFDAGGTFLGYRGFASNITAEIMVRREAGLLKEAFQQVTEPFVLWGPDERLVVCNDAYMKLNQNFASILVPGIAFEDVLRAVANEGHVTAAIGREEEWIVERLETHRLPEHSHYLQLSGDRHMMIHQQKLSNGAVAWFGLDITQLKQAERRAEEAHRQLTDAIEALPDGFCLYDSDDRLALFNSHYATFMEAFGLKAEVGLSYEEGLRKAAASGLFNIPEGGQEEWIEKRLALHRSQEVVRFDRPFKDGWARAIESSTSDGSRVGLRIDITELKEQEAELRRAREAAEIATSAKSMFLANMSHELRTPLNGVIGLSRLLAETQLDEKQRDYMAKIEASSESLLSIVKDVLDFSKIEAGEMVLDVTDFGLDVELRRLSDVMALRAAEKGLDFRIDVDPDTPMNLTGDPVRIGQILLNFLSNAVKFTERGEVVLSIETEAIADSHAALHFSVRDTGVGMTDQQAANVFKSFTQADPSTTRRFGGTGLGLSISRSLADLLGGEIWVESTPGKGSTFHLRLQVALGTASTPYQAKAFECLAGMRVLVADNSETARILMHEMLSRMGIETYVVEGGAEAIAAAVESGPFDAFLIDYRMPEVDGLMACRSICEAAEAKGDDKPRILIVSADESETLKEAAREAGAMGVLTKPINASVLFDGAALLFDKMDLVAGKKGQSVPPDGLRGLRVLLVEDNAINREVADAVLGKAGIIVTPAENGLIALNLLRAEGRGAFDAVLMDIQMPVMDGYAATEIIRDEPEFDDLPVIAMTANAMANEREKCFAVGMQDHVAKPIENKKLFAALWKWCIIKEEGSTAAPDAGAEQSGGQAGSEEGALVEDSNATELTSDDLAKRYEPLAEMIGDASMVGRFLGQFRESFSDARAVFAGHVDVGDHESAHRYAHQIKGVAGNLRLNDIFEQSKLVEGCFKDADSSSETCAGVLEELLSLIDAEMLLIDRHLAENA